MEYNSTQTDGRATSSEERLSEIKFSTSQCSEGQLSSTSDKNPSEENCVMHEKRMNGTTSSVEVLNEDEGGGGEARGNSSGGVVRRDSWFLTAAASSSHPSMASCSSSSFFPSSPSSLTARSSSVSPPPSTLSSICKSASSLQRDVILIGDIEAKLDVYSKSLLPIPRCMIGTDHTTSGFFDNLNNDTIQPPVTIATLQELDLHSIQHNVNLRIDIGHDPELFFQPISGRKGDTKRNEAKRYWSALVFECQIYHHNNQVRCEECEQRDFSTNIAFQPRFPEFFDNLRDIILMLVPESDHKEVANHLETDWLMQQILAGALDAVGLSSWLVGLLTSHCAPMRDRAAATVTEQIRLGIEHANMDMFVDGFEKLLALLEAMKLDIANHQIRSFRYQLIEGTVEFQQDCFAKAIEIGQISISDSQKWYRNQFSIHRRECGMDEATEEARRFACLIHGLVSLCNPNEKKVPVTLQYDQNRISRLQEDLQDHVQMNLCLSVFHAQANELVGAHCDASSIHNDLKRRIICLTEDDEGNGSAISDHLDAISVEITRAAMSLSTSDKKFSATRTNFEFQRTLKRLHDEFDQEDRDQPVTQDFLSRLEAKTMYYAKQFRRMTTLEISTSQKQWAQNRASKDQLLADWDEMARKLAHIGVIHWRVWRDLCYWEQPECNTYNDSNNDELESRVGVIGISDGVHLLGCNRTPSTASSPPNGMRNGSERSMAFEHTEQ